MSDAFQDADDASAIHALAGEMLRIINGIARVRLDRPDPISLGNVRRYRDSGAKDAFGFPAPIRARLRMGTPSIAVNGVLVPHDRGSETSNSPIATNGSGRSLPSSRSGRPGTASMPLLTRSSRISARAERRVSQAGRTFRRPSWSCSAARPIPLGRLVPKLAMVLSSRRLAIRWPSRMLRNSFVTWSNVGWVKSTGSAPIASPESRRLNADTTA